MIDINLIKFDRDSVSKEMVFTKLSTLVVENGYASDVKSVIGALFEREAEGTTGMMEGFAIPHAKSESIQKPGVVILRLANGIEWESMDGKPITSVIALFIPDGESDSTHLQYLSKIARLLMNNTFKEEFNESITPEEIYSVLNSYLE